MKSSLIPPIFLDAIFQQARREYPRECCGMLTSRAEIPNVIAHLRPCRNLYDAYHALDPDNFPRSAGTAYFMDPRELLKIQKANRVLGEMIRVIYHSHIDADAYFSGEDERMAAPEKEPAYPGTDYLVISVMRGEVKDANLFSWNARQKKYLL